MFQRKSRRQAGFIRKVNRDMTQQLRAFQQKPILLRDQSCQFSPFKDFVCEPQHMMISTQRFATNTVILQENYTSREYNNYLKNHKNSSMTLLHQNQYNDDIKKKKKRQRKRCSENSLINWQQNLNLRKTKSYQIGAQNLQSSNNYQQLQNAQSPTLWYKNDLNQIKLTTQDEEIQYIKRQVPILEKQPNMTLAEAFEKKCSRMKNRLQAQRKKFSRSLNKENSSFCQKIYQDKGIQNIIPFKTIKFDIPVPPKKIKNKNLRSIDKQNMGDNANIPSSCKKQQLNITNNTKFMDNKTNRTQNQENKPVKFFIPAPTARSKPITPRQAYHHSFKKWKQLPQVVEKQKQKQKQQQLRERLCRVRAHSLEVRKKLRK